MFNVPHGRLVAATPGYGMAGPAPEHGGPGFIQWVIGLVTAAGGGAIVTAYLKRRQSLDQINERRTDRLMEKYDQRIAQLEARVASLETERDAEREENLQLKQQLAAEQSKSARLAQELDAKIQTLAHVSSERVSFEGRIGALTTQVTLLLEHIARSARSVPPLVAAALPAAQGSGVMVVLTDGSISEADAGATAIYGAPPVGRGVLDLIPAEYHNRHLAGFAEALQSREVPAHPEETDLLRADGSRVRVKLRMTKVNGDGALRGFRVEMWV